MTAKTLSDKIRVLQVFGSLNMGGAESRMMDVYRHIDRQYINFDFLILRTDKQAYEDEVRSLGGNVYRLKMPSAFTAVHHIEEIRKILREGHYQAVHAHTSYHSGLVMYAAWREGVKVRITHARTTGSVRPGIARATMQFAGKALIKQFATKCYAISQQAGQFLFDSSQFEVLPNAIDVEKYQNTDLKKCEQLRNSFDIPDRAFVIGQIGRFDPMKNHVFSLRWFSKYCETHSDALLILVGDHTNPIRRQELEHIVDDLHISKQVRFTGFRADIEDVLRLFDVLLFPSLYEGLGGVVLEAQAAGIPAVISESVPEEVDMGIGLVQRCSLNDEYESWDQAVDRCREKEAIPFDMICKAFDDHHYSLTNEIEHLQKEYEKGRWI